MPASKYYWAKYKKYRASVKRYWKTPRGRYSLQKRQAKVREISWQFTFDSWWLMWNESGKWNLRGCGKGKYNMCRYHDTGPYSPNNCYIDLATQNAREGARRGR